MNLIQMYASSSLLKSGLHRVLAVAHTLVSDLSVDENGQWWSLLDEVHQDAGRQHRLSMEDLARVFALDSVKTVIDRARELLHLSRLDYPAVQRAFRASVISGRAYKAHMGRDIYGVSNKALWDAVCADFGAAVADQFGLTLGEEFTASDESSPSDRAMAVLRALTSFDTSPDGVGHKACVDWLEVRLGQLGFSVEILGVELGRPLLIARRSARGMAGHVVLYGHYDVTPYGSELKWDHPPRELTWTEGRFFARGVADNKGPLACRIAALEGMANTPALTWILQGEEETRSPVAHQLLPDVMRNLSATVWLDETGYHDHEDGTLRLLGRMIGPADASLPPDGALDDLLRGLRGLASRWGVASRFECRGLNKHFVEGGCPFNRSLPTGSRYLAIGVNDSGSRIHALNESVPGWTFPLHASQLDVVFHWVDHLEGGRRARGV